MAKKNKKISDVGLTYMKELGFRSAGSVNVAFDRMSSVADKELVDNLVRGYIKCIEIIKMEKY